MRKSLVVLFVFGLGACRQGPVQQLAPPPAEAMCGDGNLDPGEACDGSRLGDQTCVGLGFEGGSLRCDATCHFVTAACFRRCGNGVLDPGEACDGPLGLGPCPTFGFQSCTDTCTVDARHCVSTPFEPGPVLELVHGGPSSLGDLEPKGPGDLLVAVPSYGRVEVFPWVSPVGFDPTTSRKLSFQRTPVLAQACDGNADGAADIATIDEDGSFAISQWVGPGYTMNAFDAGCRGATFLGARHVTGPAAATQAIAEGCGAAWVLEATGPLRLALPDGGVPTLAVWPGAELLAVPAFDPSSLALLVPGDGGTRLSMDVVPERLVLGDVDGDGDLDAAALCTGQVWLLENTGADFARRASLPAPAATLLALTDLDGDGKVDLVFGTGGVIEVRRNLGTWRFAPFTIDAGPGLRLSTSLGDVDGDGDDDLAVTIATTPPATRTLVFLNRVR